MTGVASVSEHLRKFMEKDWTRENATLEALEEYPYQEAETSTQGGQPKAMEYRYIQVVPAQMFWVKCPGFTP